ncbi:thiazole biosynthesis protein [Candidatus Bathyarchaeota archaeon]|nr:thiazole biosynthesis protein [Candidatus Bathyarchaeota archaeon]
MKDVEESTITRAIIRKATEDWINLARTDVIVVGAGPSGLTAAMYLAKAGLKTVVFERKLSFGGGIGGGGMQFHKLVIQAPADKILREVGCELEPLKKDLYVADTTAMIAKLASATVDAGAKIILGVIVDDLIYRDSPPRITGAVVQWTSVIMSGIHVDPLGVKAKTVIDCTGHDAEVLAVASRKIPELKLVVPGEKSMWVSQAEKLTVENTGEVCSGLYVAGMAVAALYQTPRMGPIFGGMLLSGAKVAQLVAAKILGEKASKVIPIDIG